MSIEKFTGKIKKPKKINQVKKGNPLEGFEYHTRPSDLFENGLDYVLNGMKSVARTFGINRLYENNLISEIDRRKSNLYSESHKPNWIEKVLCSTLTEDDVRPNSTSILPEKMKGETTRTKAGVPPRNYTRIMRWMFGYNGIPTVCDCCGSSLALPDLIPYKKLGQMFTTAHKIIVGAVYSSIYNYIMLCPNCVSMWKKIHTNKYAEGRYPYIVQKRLDNFYKKLISTKPAAEKMNISQKKIEMSYRDKKNKDTGQKVYKKFVVDIQQYNKINPEFSKINAGSSDELKQENKKKWEKFGK